MTKEKKNVSNQNYLVFIILFFLSPIAFCFVASSKEKTKYLTHSNKVFVRSTWVQFFFSLAAPFYANNSYTTRNITFCNRFWPFFNYCIIWASVVMWKKLKLGGLLPWFCFRSKIYRLWKFNFDLETYIWDQKMYALNLHMNVATRSVMHFYIKIVSYNC